MRTTSRSDSARCASGTGAQFLSTAANRPIHGGVFPPHGRTGFDLTAAADTDHPAIHRLLKAVHQWPSDVAFQSINDAPQYEPTDRLLVKRDDAVVAHVHLIPQVMKFGDIELRTTDLRHLATLPEYRNEDLAARLLHNALDDMRQNGSVIATTHTPLPKIYRQRGWVTCGHQSTTRISPRDLLAHLEESKHRPVGYPRPARRHVCVRPWRQHEIDQVSALYEKSTGGSYGPLTRRQSHWRWLMSRRCSYDRAYVAFESSQPCGQVDAHDETQQIVGYAVMRNDCIIELVTLDGDVQALRRLLARACRDGIENDRYEIGFNAAIDHPAHELLIAAGGNFSSLGHHNGRELMAKILDQPKFLQAIRPELWRRAKAAELPAGSRVSFQVEDRMIGFAVNKRSISLDNSPHESALRLSRAQFEQALLGFLQIDDEVRDGSIECDSPDAVRIATKLFPRLPFWRPQLDDIGYR